MKKIMMMLGGLSLILSSGLFSSQKQETKTTPPPETLVLEPAKGVWEYITKGELDYFDDEKKICYYDKLDTRRKKLDHAVRLAIGEDFVDEQCERNAEILSKSPEALACIVKYMRCPENHSFCLKRFIYLAYVRHQSLRGTLDEDFDDPSVHAFKKALCKIARKNYPFTYGLLWAPLYAGLVISPCVLTVMALLYPSLIAAGIVMGGAGLGLGALLACCFPRSAFRFLRIGADIIDTHFFDMPSFLLPQKPALEKKLKKD